MDLKGINFKKAVQGRYSQVKDYISKKLMIILLIVLFFLLSLLLLLLTQ